MNPTAKPTFLNPDLSNRHGTRKRGGGRSASPERQSVRPQPFLKSYRVCYLHSIRPTVLNRLTRPTNLKYIVPIHDSSSLGSCQILLVFSPFFFLLRLGLTGKPCVSPIGPRLFVSLTQRPLQRGLVFASSVKAGRCRVSSGQQCLAGRPYEGVALGRPALLLPDAKLRSICVTG